jgi:hypothetical protein
MPGVARAHRSAGNNSERIVSTGCDGRVTDRNASGAGGVGPVLG